MTSKEEIKQAFTIELKLTNEYQEVLLLKQALLDEIAAPNVNHQITYMFTGELTDSQVQTLNMCFKIEFGFESEFTTNKGVTVTMDKFLD